MGYRYLDYAVYGWLGGMVAVVCILLLARVRPGVAFGVSLLTGSLPLWCLTVRALWLIQDNRDSIGFILTLATVTGAMTVAGVASIAMSLRNAKGRNTPPGR